MSESMISDHKADLLIVGQTPPPHHGQAVVTGMLFEHDWTKVKVALLRMGYSDTIDAVGKCSLAKVGHLFYLILATWKIRLQRGTRVLYYLPASPHRVPIIRDVIYLSLTRFLFKRVIFHYHAGGLAEYVDKQSWLGWVARKVYGNADMSIELSASGVSPSSYFRAKNRRVIPNGLAAPDVAARKHTTGSVWEVLFVGALVEGKGIGQIVATASILKRQGAAVHFTMVGGWGDEGYRDEIFHAIQSAGLQEMFHFTGILSGKEKWDTFAAADCFFFPSHYASESFPLVLIEAMACGLPIVSTEWRGIPDLVAGSGAAMLYPVKSPELYAGAIAQLKNDPATYRKMSDAGISFYQKHYTKSVFLKRMEDAFEEVVSSLK